MHWTNSSILGCRNDSLVKHKRSTSNARLRSESFNSNGFEGKEKVITTSFIPYVYLKIHTIIIIGID